MLKKIEIEGHDVLAFEAVGKVTARDYTEILRPALHEYRDKEKKARILIQLGSEYAGFTPLAEWEDLKLGVQFFGTFGRCALVTDIKWMKTVAGMIQPLLPFPLRIFEGKEFEQAKSWLVGNHAGIEYHLDHKRGVLTVDLKEPISSDALEILTEKVDRSLRKEELKGLVIHTKGFPGWSNLGGLISHIQFIKNHHRKLKRLAVATDASAAEFAPSLAKHFLQPEVKSFGYDEVTQARDWVADAGTGMAEGVKIGANKGQAADAQQTTTPAPQG